MARKPKTKGSVKVDFSGVETRSVLPEGEYIGEVVSVKLEESQNGGEYLAWELAISGGKHDGKKCYNNTSLQEQSLWATKKFLEDLGVEVEDGEMSLDLDEYVGMQIGLVIEHEVYKGRTRSRVVDTYPAEDAGDEKGDEKGGKKDDVSYTEEQVGEMGKKELKELIEEHDLDVDTEGSTSTVRRNVIKALKKADLIGDGAEKEEKSSGRRGKTSKVKDDEAEEKEDKSSRRSRRGKEDEEEEKSSKKSGKGKKTKYTADAINEMDEEALGEVIEKHELDVDLDDHGTMRRKRSAVIDKLEEADLLED